MYRVGEEVRVLYLARAPAASAIIDHGVWNLLPMFILETGGLAFLRMGLSMWWQQNARHISFSVSPPPPDIPTSAAISTHGVTSGAVAQSLAAHWSHGALPASATTSTSAWIARAEDALFLGTLLSHYAHLKTALWSAVLIVLVLSVLFMASAQLTFLVGPMH